MLRLVELNWTAILFRREVVEAAGYLAANVLSADTQYEPRITLTYPLLVNHRICAFRFRRPGSAGKVRGLAYCWPNLPNIMRSLTADENIGPAVWQRLRTTITGAIIRKLIRLSVVAAIGGRLGEARRMASILQLSFQKRRTALLLRVFSWGRYARARSWRTDGLAGSHTPFLEASPRALRAHGDRVSIRGRGESVSLGPEPSRVRAVERQRNGCAGRETEPSARVDQWEDEPCPVSFGRSSRNSRGSHRSPWCGRPRKCAHE